MPRTNVPEPRLPSFVIIGAQKSGTSWLREALRQHPEVFIVRGEVHFFDKQYNYAKGLDWYRSFFEAATGQSAIGEKTPDYFWTNGRGSEQGHLPQAHELLYKALPEARLIVLLRNPVERAISAVNHLKRHCFISPLPGIDRLLLGDKREVVRPFGVIDKGFYCRHLEAYCSLYDRSQILVMIYEEDVLEEPKRGLEKVCRFLDIDPGFRFQNVHARINGNPASPVSLLLRYHLRVPEPSAGRWGHRLTRLIPGLPPRLGRPREETIRKLYRIYASENQRLYGWLGREIPAWEEAYRRYRRAAACRPVKS